MPNSGRSAELEEIWALFAQEGRDNLNLVEECLLGLEKNPSDTQQVAALFRAMHSFKGGVRMMGLSVIETLSHRAEDLIALVRDDGVALEQDMINLLLVVLDRQRVMLDYVLSYGHDVEPEQAEKHIADLDRMIAAKKTAVPEPIGAPIMAGPTATVELTDVSASAQPSAPVPEGETASLPEQATELTDSTPDALANFLQTAGTTLGQLHSSVDAFLTGAEGALAQVQLQTAPLRQSAENLGYRRLAGVLDELANQAQVVDAAKLAPADREACALRFKNLELSIFGEITRIQEAGAESPGETSAPPPNAWADIAWLFRHWHAENVFADFARLREIVDALDKLMPPSNLDMDMQTQLAQLAEEATVHLRAIYHGSIFYHLEPAVHLTLALEDLFARVGQGEIQLNRALTQMIRDYVTGLGSVIEALQEGEEPSLELLAQLIEQAEGFLYTHTATSEQQMARSVLDVLDLPADFKQVITPEVLTQFNQALQANEEFYTILADLERNRELAEAFFEWAQTNNIRLLTNLTVYRYRRSLFNFLIASPLNREEMVTSLAKIDSQWQYLTLRQCSLRKPADAPTQPAKPSAPTEAPTVQPSQRVSVDISAQTLAEVSELISGMVADTATLHRVIVRLGETDWVEAMLRIIRETRGDEVRMRRELQNFLGSWEEGISVLRQVENNQSSAIGNLQEAIRSLRLAPVAEIFEPLAQWVQAATESQNKMIELSLEGADLNFDRDVLQVLAEPVKQLVWFAATQGIEHSEQRQAAGKAATGHIVVKASAHEAHVQIVVQDDGSGVVDPTQAPEWVAIESQVQAHQGQLNVTREPGQGTRYALRLPLDHVVMDGMVVRVDDVRYVVPVNSIRRIIKPEAEHLVRSSAEGKRTMLRFEGEVIPIDSLMGHQNTNGDYKLLMIIEDENTRVALPIDELIGRQQVLVRPLHGQMADIRQVSGCALLGEGEVGMVLNLGVLQAAI